MSLYVTGRWPMWRNEQRARGCRPSTVAYREKALGILAKFWDGPPEALTPALLLQWREALTDYGYAVATVNGYLRAVRAFCNWLVSEGVLAEAPRFRLLSERDTPDPQVYSATDLAKLMKGTAGKQGRSKYEAIRDAAIIALLQDSGLRASECAGLLLENIDLDARQAYVHPDIAKGGRPRTVTFGFTAAKLLHKYVLARRKHAYAFMPQLFLGRQGPAYYALIRRVVRTAGERVGIEGARPHLLRHSWAHNMKDKGADLETLMALGGWSSSEMPMRYGRAGREARAVAAYQRLGSPVDTRK